MARYEDKNLSSRIREFTGSPRWGSQKNAQAGHLTRKMHTSGDYSPLVLLAGKSYQYGP